MKCQKCAIQLQQQEKGNAMMDSCCSCGGVWSTKKNLETVKIQYDDFLRWIDFDLWKEDTLHKAQKTDCHCPTP